MHRRTKLLGVAGLTAGLLLVGAACPDPDESSPSPEVPSQIQSSDTTMVTGGRPECPHSWNWQLITIPFDGRRQNVTTIRPDGMLTGPGVTQNIPEYHDCQPFLNEAGTDYGGFLAIFASNRMARLDTLALADTAGHVPESALTLAGAHPAAQIFAEAPYPPLHIREGFNCLYLFREGGVWEAKMSPPLPGEELRERDCFQPIDHTTLPDSLRLHVRVRTFPHLRKEDYPEVARWDFDPRRGQTGGDYSMRVGCGASECLVGPPGWSPAGPVLETQQQGDPLHDRNFLIEGWHDEQMLAMLPVGGRAAEPSGVVGVIVPHRRLRTYTSPDSLRPKGNQTFHPAAYVALPDSIRGYARKFGLYRTGPNGPFNQVGLCHGSATECLPASAVEETQCPRGADGMWWARITGPSGQTPVYRCLIFRLVTGGIPIPPTVRWRWLVNDDGAWMRCPQGCCELR